MVKIVFISPYSFVLSNLKNVTHAPYTSQKICHIENKCSKLNVVQMTTFRNFRWLFSQLQENKMLVGKILMVTSLIFTFLRSSSVKNVLKSVHH